MLLTGGNKRYGKHDNIRYKLDYFDSIYSRFCCRGKFGKWLFLNDMVLLFTVVFVLWGQLAKLFAVAFWKIRVGWKSALVVYITDVLALLY